MNKLRRWRVALLGLVVILITFSLFVGLPTILPDPASANFNKLVWACTQRGIPPVIYDTWLWDTSEQPEFSEWRECSKFEVISDDIRNGLKSYNLMGKIKIEANTENNNSIILSGYLQYGFFFNTENQTDTLSLMRPLPEKIGGLKQRQLLITLTSVYEDDNKKDEYEVITNHAGAFTQEIEIDPKCICYKVKIDFYGDIFYPPDLAKPVEVYFGTEGEYATCSPEWFEFEISKPYWLIAVVAIGILLLTAVLYRYLKRRRKFIQIESGIEELTEQNPDRHKLSEKEFDSGGDTTQVKIVFPDITDQLPVVWGVGESLTADINLTGRKPGSPESTDCFIDWGDEEQIQEYSCEDVRFSVSHSFITKRDYRIKMFYTDAFTGKEVSAWRRIRIVDYREEIVRLFNELLGTLDMEQVTLNSEMTAREVEKLLNERLSGLQKGTIREMISVFEEANYSTHTVDRESYLRMYRVIQNLPQKQVGR